MVIDSIEKLTGTFSTQPLATDATSRAENISQTEREAAGAALNDDFTLRSSFFILSPTRAVAPTGGLVVFLPT